MPTYAIVYVLVFAALSIANWQICERNQLSTPWLRNGDLISTAGSLLLTVAFWNEELREALGLFAVPIFVACLSWFIYAIRPAIEIGESMVGEMDEARRRPIALMGVGFTLLVCAPALFCGWRVALAALAA